MVLRALLQGLRAERRAARSLRQSGLRILARNVRAGGGEIDLIAREGQVLVAVEVRERAAGVLAADLSVDAAKLRRIERALRAFRRARRLPPALPERVDLVLMAPGCDPVHLRGVAPP